MSAIDRPAALQFLRTAYEPDDWVAVFLKAYDTDRTLQRVVPLRQVSEAPWQTWLRVMNRYRFNVYVSVNAIRAGQRRRTKDAIANVRHVFLDADRHGSCVLAELDAKSDVPPASYVLYSSPDRVHVFWRVRGFTTDGVERVQRQLARTFGTDTAATSCSQTTRLPGFLNTKYDQAPVVSIEYRDTTSSYAPADFPAASVESPIVRRHTLGSTAPPSAALERARRYLAVLPPAVAGQHGDVHTFRVCCRLARGFALSDNDALTLLADWNVKCEPPWSERDLIEKLRRARQYGGEPIGGLLGAHA